MTTMMNTADRAIDQVEDTASNAQAAFREFSARVGQLINGVRKAQTRSIDALLRRLGLQRRQSAFKPIFWLAAGAVAAGMAVILISPTAGKEVRRRIATIFGAETGTHASLITSVEQKGKHAATCEASPVTNGALLESG